MADAGAAAGDNRMATGTAGAGEADGIGGEASASGAGLERYVHPRTRLFRSDEAAPGVHWAQHQEVGQLVGHFRRLYDLLFIYVRRGVVEVSFGDGVTVRCGAGQMMLVPSHLSHRIAVPEPEGASLTGVHFDFYGEFDFRTDQLFIVKEPDPDVSRFCSLPANEGGEWLFPRRPFPAPQSVPTLMDAIVESFGARKEGFELVCRGLLLQLIGELLGADRSAPEGAALDAALVGAAREAAARMLADVGAQWSNAELARSLHVSEDYFIRLFRKANGMTPYRYLQYARFREAQRLLRDTPLPVGEVGRRVGFAEIHHFSQFFKRWQGVSPGEYRKLCRIL